MMMESKFRSKGKGAAGTGVPVVDGVLSLEEAIWLFARLADVPVEHVREWIGLDVRRHFRYACEGRDGWRVPEGDVWALLGREEWLCVESVAVRLDFEPDTVRRWIRKGLVRADLVMGFPRVPRSEVHRLVREGNVAGLGRGRRGFGCARRRLASLNGETKEGILNVDQGVVG